MIYHWNAACGILLWERWIGVHLDDAVGFESSDKLMFDSCVNKSKWERDERKPSVVNHRSMIMIIQRSNDEILNWSRKRLLPVINSTRLKFFLNLFATTLLRRLFTSSCTWPSYVQTGKQENHTEIHSNSEKLSFKRQATIRLGFRTVFFHSQLCEFLAGFWTRFIQTYDITGYAYALHVICKDEP